MNNMMEKKRDAQIALNKNQLNRALTLYSEALEIAEYHFPGHEEIPKLLSNRALVFLKRRQFHEAIRDSSRCCESYPHWVKVMLYSKKWNNVHLPYVKHALNVRYKTYVKCMDRAPYV